MKNIYLLTVFQLKNNKKLIIGWTVALFSMMFLYMILFPYCQDMATVKMETMPEELFQLFGMDSMSDLADFVTYFGMIYNILLVAISIFAVSFGANCIASEERNKTIEFLYSLEVSRLDIYISKFLMAYISLMIVIMATISSAILCGFINGGETFVLMDVLTIMKLSSLTPFVFLGLGVMLSGISGKISGAMIGSIVVLFSYMCGFISTLATKLDWFVYLSPFELFSPTNALSFDSTFIMQLLAYLLLLGVFVFIGGYVYKQRDYHI
ncbi:ABC transporter permease subunit [Tannockella kyphosi]|uniref:ABC transporter permease subunit n=1 Tax=Tannockella kyphosi TaxID=2899121 RepID=UPI002012EE1E|nr:ABC transporter permease subunit [Tannockella kyphosi]